MHRWFTMESQIKTTCYPNPVEMKGTSKSGGRWLTEHFQDGFVRQAQQHGLRSRAVYKLKEMDERDRLFKPGMKIIDLGASPGGWSQYVIPRLGTSGKLIALDILPMDDLPGVTFIQGDFREHDVFEQLIEVLSGEKVEIVLSDMAPNMSGVRVTDQAKAMELAELALNMATDVLKPGGVFLTKLFQGSGFPEFQKTVKPYFEKVVFRKPKASRSQSREVYLLARGFKFSK